MTVGPYNVTHEIALGQQKTDENVGGLLILPQLQAAIDAMPSDNFTFIVTKIGSPLTRESFGNWFHECCIEAGLTAEVVDASGRAKGLCLPRSPQANGRAPRASWVRRRVDRCGAGAQGYATSEGLHQGCQQRRMARSALASLIEAEQPRTHALQTEGKNLQTGRQALEKKGA